MGNATKRTRRARGEGSIYPDAGGGYRGAITYRDAQTGRTIRKTVRGKTKAIVNARLEDLRRQVAQGGAVAGELTVAAFLTRWLEAEERGDARPATLRGRRQHVQQHIIPAIGALRLRELLPSHVRHLTDTMQRPTAGAKALSGRTAAHVRATLRRALRDAERDGLVSRNVAALAKAPSVERVEMRILSPEQTATLIAGTADDRFGPAFTVAAVTGLRQGELLGLRWSDVANLDDDAPTLTVRRALARAAGGGWALAEPKTPRSRRTLELEPTAVRALRRQRARQGEARLAAGDLWRNADDLVFTDELGQPLSSTTVTKAFSVALERLGLPHVRFHDLRHGAASMMLANDTPLKVVSDALGHSTIVITADIYAHLDREQRREAMSAIERAIGGEA